MANTLLTIDMITREALRIAHEKAAFLGTINRQFDAEFGKKGGKVGDTLRIRLPAQYVRRQGSRIMDVQDAEEQQTTLVVSKQDGVDMTFNSAELALSLDDFSKRHLEPAMAVLVSGIEADVLAGVTKRVWNQVGTWGTPPSDLQPISAARAYMNQDLAPKDDQRYIQYDSLNMGTLVHGLKGLFHDATDIKKQYREGMIGRAAGFDWYENERLYAHATGADHTTVTINDAGVGVEGVNEMTTAGATVTVGTVFTIGNVNKVHPETKQPLGRAQQFVITAVNGNDWKFEPAIYSSGAKQNVDALPVNGATITLFGNASQTKTQALAYHKDAFTFATAELPMMDGQRCVTQTYDGLSIRVWQAPDIKNDELLTRIDILYGYAAIRPQWACRISM